MENLEKENKIEKKTKEEREVNALLDLIMLIKDSDENELVYKLTEENKKRIQDLVKDNNIDDTKKDKINEIIEGNLNIEEVVKLRAQIGKYDENSKQLLKTTIEDVEKLNKLNEIEENER